MRMCYLSFRIRHAIPDKYSSYQHSIRACDMPRYHWDRGVDMTIQEGWVPVDQAQRRPGGGALITDGGAVTECKYRGLRWGDGYLSKGGICEGGIFMASK